MKKTQILLIALTITTCAFLNLAAAEETNPKAENIAPEVVSETVPPEAVATLATAPEVATPKAVAPEEGKCKILDGVEFLTGFGWGKLRTTRNYNLIPFVVDFNFDLKPITRKIHINPPGLLQFQLEPYASFIFSPKSNVELGSGLLAFKWGVLPETSKIQPYLKIGAGMSYMTLHTVEQGTQFNFIEYGGIGVHYFFAKNTALTIEGRYRHLSNASIGDPNSGINTAFGLVGVSYQF
ncbi:MAG: acyloxyacyl hydrolase [Candidatus Omnitrophica bacterium]|nr:acyloxyacyl hydrolase [Candidatus Omnitrophota bacterium]